MKLNQLIFGSSGPDVFGVKMNVLSMEKVFNDPSFHGIYEQYAKNRSYVPVNNAEQRHPSNTQAEPSPLKSESPLVRAVREQIPTKLPSSIRKYFRSWQTQFFGRIRCCVSFNRPVFESDRTALSSVFRLWTWVWKRRTIKWAMHRIIWFKERFYSRFR